MSESLINRANEIISILNQNSIVKKCTIYGSLATNTYDELSDIDIEIDVSGYDNGKFMLELVDLIKDNFNVHYCDYAPSLIPDKYIVSIAIDEENPFLVVDLCCCAEPHCTNVTKQQVMAKNEINTHILKLWTANLKHYVRNVECYEDIVRMAKRAGIEDLYNKDEIEMLEETLCWIENNVGHDLRTFVRNCRIKFEELVY